jgi:hypothetical protein
MFPAFCGLCMNIPNEIDQNIMCTIMCGLDGISKTDKFL